MSKRGSGEGSVYKDAANELWYGVLPRDEATGRRKKTTGCKTQREALNALAELKRQQAQGVNVHTEHQTVAQFLTHWLETTGDALKLRTQQSYRSVIRLYLTLHIGRYVLTKLTGQHVQTMLNKLTAQGLSARTVQYARAVLRKALNQAIKWGLIARNAAAQSEGPRVEKYQIEPLTIAQAQQLLDAVSGHRLEALYRVALSLGLRRGEVLALRWADVNFEKRTLRIAATLHQGRTFGTPKSKSGIRTLSLPDALIDALRAHWRTQQEERVLLGVRWAEHGLVFASEVGTPIEPRNLLRQFKKILTRAGLPLTIRFHDLRHSAASLMIAQGVHLSVIKEILGHSQISITADIYGHVAADTQREASEKLSHVLNKKAKNG